MMTGKTDREAGGGTEKGGDETGERERQRHGCVVANARGAQRS